MRRTALGIASIVLCGIAIAPLLVQTEQLPAPPPPAQAALAQASMEDMACSEAIQPSRAGTAAASGCRTEGRMRVTDAR
jgi:hypothetical protein